MHRRTHARLAPITVAALVACNTTLDDGVQFGTGDSGEAAASASDGDGSLSLDSTAADDTSSVDDTAGVDDTEGVKYDVGAGTETGGDPNGCECGSQLGFSYIWVANSTQGTVSKINTTTLVEEGRYLTRPDGLGNPSRTSVSLSGHAVAVANRNGGVVKIWALPEMCDPMQNGVPDVQTSIGGGVALPWGEDDCIAWYTAFENTVTQRPIAWIAGDQDPVTCAYSNEKVWTARGGNEGSFVHLLNGDDGVIEATITDSGLSPGPFGQYGGAADGHGNFWISVNGSNGTYPDLVAVSRDDFTSKGFEFPDGVSAYGITVDAEDRVVLSSYAFPYGVARFDPSDETWSLADVGFASGGGVVVAGDGRIWAGDQNAGVAWIDGSTLELGGLVELPESLIKGMSVDVDGFVWAVGSVAYKIDPDTLEVVGMNQGLSSPYTYSDMTGWALQNAACEPAG